ncbi:histidine-rich glycoprotein-like [Ischnura elegans]|uniref:histidine-rich glycoprotein-like n=1 Tax=Ischnura elegans TaxID=197161 RepID=UPI001ED86AFF|nr:histidine-rich glycoprotein-like [Ischnura elegans]
MLRRHSSGGPAGLLLLISVVLLLSALQLSAAEKDKHQDGHPKATKIHHRVPTHHMHAAAKVHREEPSKKAHHHPTTATPTSVHHHHTAAPKGKAPAAYQHLPEHHVDKHAKHRLEEPKRRLEEQKPPKPFLQPPHLPKHQDRPVKHHYARQEKSKHH